MADVIREGIAKLLRDHPLSTYTVTGLHRSFPHVVPETIRYHLRKLRNEGCVLQPKFAQYQWNKEFISLERKRAMALEAGKERVVQSDRPFSYKEPAIQASYPDNHWVIHYRARVENVIKRMGSPAPARDLFMSDDIELIEKLLEQVLKPVLVHPQ